jgi:phospholipid:diacylglycerol acyltransferase
MLTIFYFLRAKYVFHFAGNAGPGWAEQHVAEYVVIAGAMLGTPKVLAGLISGEIRDTAEMQGLQQYLTSTVVPHSSRTALWRSWGSLLSLIPFGDERIWGNATYAPDLPDSAGVTIMMEAPASAIEAVGYEQSTPTRPLVHAGNLTLEQTMKFLFSESIGGVDLQAKLAEHSFGADPEGRLLHAHDLEPRHWANPLEARLPNAPSLRIYSLYGIGIPTERAYFYTPTRGEESDVPVPVTKTARTSPQEEETLKWGDYAEAMKPKVLIDKTVHREPGAAGTTVKSGVLTTDGDGTVPLISLGYMCVKGWKEKRFNPAGASLPRYTVDACMLWQNVRWVCAKLGVY